MPSVLEITTDAGDCSTAIDNLRFTSSELLRFEISNAEKIAPLERSSLSIAEALNQISKTFPSFLIHLVSTEPVVNAH